MVREAVRAGANAVGLDGDAAVAAVASQEVSNGDQKQDLSKPSVEELKAKSWSFFKKSGTFAPSSAAKAGTEVAGLDGEPVFDIFNEASDSVTNSSAQKLTEAFSQTVDNCLRAQPEGRPARRGFMFLIDGLEHVSPACAVKDLALLKNIFNVRNVLSIDSSFIAKGLESKSGDASADPEAFIGGIAQSSFSYPVTAQDVTEFLETSLKNAGCFGAEDLSREISLSLPVTGLTNTVLGIIAEMTRLSAGPDANGIGQIVEILSGMKGGQSDTSEVPAPTPDDIDCLVGYGLGCLLVAYPEVYDYIVKNPASMVWNKEQIKRFMAQSFLSLSKLLNLGLPIALAACKNVMSREEALYTCNDNAFGMKLPGLNASKLLVIIRSLTAPDQLEARIRRITALISENMDSVPEEETSAEPDTISERRQATLDARYSFWKSFLSYAFKNPEFAEHFRKKKPTQGSWVTFGIGATGCHIGVTFNIRKNELRAELFIRDDRKLYFTLASQKKAIEAEAGLSFEWRDVGGKNSSIRIENHSFKLASKRDRHKQFDWLIDVVLRMRKAFVKYL